MRALLLWSLIVVAWIQSGLCRASAAGIQMPSTPPPLVLISLDGFRWDYTALHPAETTFLRQLMREGISARGLIPVYPSNTFPNHYSIVTGLYPATHGIINNRMFDPRFGEAFRYNRVASVQDARWWGGEPIWVTAVKQGRKSGCLFWVGSETPVGGVRPTLWKEFDPKLPFESRLAELVEWLSLPDGKRPSIVTFYLEETNSVGHHHGPESSELVATVELLDAQLREMRTRLETRGVSANYVIVSDHGMVNCGPERVLLLDDYLDLSTIQIDFDESSVGLRPLPGTSTEAVMQALSRLPSVQARAYRAKDLPAHLHIDPSNPRVPPIWIVVAEGWNVTRRSTLEAAKGKTILGQHGYDPTLQSMHGILVAFGPSFKTTGEVIEPVENIHVYNLLCAALGLKAAPNDGDDRLVRAMLK